MILISGAGFRGRQGRFSSELTVFSVHICDELLTNSFPVYNSIQYCYETTEINMLFDAWMWIEFGELITLLYVMLVAKPEV